MGRITTTGVGSYILSYFGYHPNELVSRNQAATWDDIMGCPKRRFSVNF